jgi:hypothetical protein
VGAAWAGWKARDRARMPVAAAERFEERLDASFDQPVDLAAPFRAEATRQLRKLTGPLLEEQYGSASGLAGEDAGRHVDALGRACHDVRIGRNVHHVVDEHGSWRVESLLARGASPVPGARVRLPAGLMPADAGAGFRAGDLVASFKRELFVAPLEEALGQREVRAPGGAVLARVPSFARCGVHPAALYVGGDDEESVAVAFVEITPGEPLRYELRTRDGHEDLLERLLRVSLATLEVPVAGTAAAVVTPAALERVVLANGLAVATPGGVAPGLWLDGERIEVDLHRPAHEGEVVTLEAVKTNARQVDAQRLAEVEVPGTALPWRAVYRWEGSFGTSPRLIVVGAGIVNGEGVIVTATGPFDAAGWRGQLARFQDAISSVAPLADEELWPEASAAYDWTPASLRLPRTWHARLSKQGIELEGYHGDRIEVVVQAPRGEDGFSYDTHELDFEKHVPLRDGRRITVRAVASTPERRQRVLALVERVTRTIVPR